MTEPAKIRPMDSRPAPSGREQRTAPRVPARIPVELEVDGTSVTTTTHDISATGAAVEYGGAVELGQVFSIAFALPDDGEEIACAGLVRSFRPGKQGGRIVGVEFHNLPPEKRRAIARYVRWVMSGEDVQAAAAAHWSGADHGAASVVDASDVPVVRWAPGFSTLFLEVAAHLQTVTQVFVPVVDHGLSEGDRVWFELVPPNSHVVVRSMGEVTWVEREGEAGVGLRLAGLTPLDRAVLAGIKGWFDRERARYS